MDLKDGEENYVKTLVVPAGALIALVTGHVTVQLEPVPAIPYGVEKDVKYLIALARLTAVVMVTVLVLTYPTASVNKVGWEKPVKSHAQMVRCVLLRMATTYVNVIHVTVEYHVILNVLEKVIAQMEHVTVALMAGVDLHVKPKDVLDGIKTAQVMAHVLLLSHFACANQDGEVKAVIYLNVLVVGTAAVTAYVMA